MTDRDLALQLSKITEQKLRTQGRLRTLVSTLRSSIRGSPDEEIPRLGWWRGTLLWWESVVAPFYSTWISAAVYFGAAVLLLFIGLRRFTHIVSNEAVVASLVLEAVLLVLLCLVLLASPPTTSPPASPQEWGEQIHNIAKDMDAIVSSADKVLTQHEKLLNCWSDSVQNQEELLRRFAETVASLQSMPQPGSALLNALEGVQQAVKKLDETLHQIAGELQHWRSQQLQGLIQQELLRLASTALSNQGGVREQSTSGNA
ncbi:MAG: hypothetical protein NZ949_05215 [Candidatus Kapabacteria bacterium]|nr:hypothetical protein [Candidatus Kapabacteria bacterium]MDW7996854.1 hypothetical protein [Bacteroidota bacterium]